MTLKPYIFDDSRNTPKNVRDEFLNMTTEAINEVIKNGTLPFISVCMNLTSDFNKASVIRAHNAFLGDSVIIVGTRRFDRRGTVGMHHYTNVLHAETWEDARDHLRALGYTLIAVDNVPDFSPVSVYEADFPEKVAFIYGEEQKGLSVEVVADCDMASYIPQRGVVRSLNVAQCAAVMMSEYVRRHG